MNKIEVKKLRLENQRITVEFDVDGSDEWKSFFVKPYIMFAEYNFPVESIPYSVAIVPFVANMLPLIWLFDAELIIDEIDEAYYNSIPDFQAGYMKLHPKFDFGGKISFNRTVENHSVVPAERTAALFSGGVDATFTMLSHIEENPVLITIWGADMHVDNVEGWTAIYNHAKKVADKFELDQQTVRSNFSVVQDKDLLIPFICQKEPDTSWYEHFLYGIAFFGLMAPLAYTLGVKLFYIASSNNPDYVGSYSCSSDPIIDDYIHFVDASCKHDGFDKNRQDKIHGICEYNKKYNKGIDLHVCFYDGRGVNCGVCEKCCRTMLEILAEDENPANYGFDNFDDNLRAQMIYNLRHKYWMRCYFGRYDYEYTQRAIKKRYTYKECPDDLKWFYRLKMTGQYPKWLSVYKWLSKQMHSVLKLLHIEK